MATPKVRSSLPFKLPVLLLALVLLAVLSLWLALRASLPQTSGEAVLPGLSAPVTISFDQWQRPYARAATMGDALAAQGWLHAGNRLWQMELFRRAGLGRMSELLGPDLLGTDRELWRAGVPQLAAKLEANASPATLELVDHYLAGVNSAIAAYRVLPPEFLLLRAPRPEWRRRDVFAIGALMAFQSANNMHNELLRLALSKTLDSGRFSAFLTDDSSRGNYPFVIAKRPRKVANVVELTALIDRVAQTDPDYNPLMPRLGFGSNGWVVAAQKSTTGSPLFAFDSHDELGLPDLFYEVHLFFGAGRQLRGWSVAGLPGVINGFNESIAWGFTNIGDTQDLFLETRASDDSRMFLDGDEWYEAREEHVSIPVKGREAEPLIIVHTRNGPLINEQPAISLAWAVQRIPEPSLDSMLASNLARDWKEFTAALDDFPAPTLNATYADVHGTIGFRTGGVIPLRGAGVGLLPQDGSRPAHRWQGMVPASQMPEQANPPTGFLAAANSRVNGADDGVLVSADNAAPYRIARIQQVLSSMGKISPQDMQQLQVDWMDGQAQLLLPQLLSELGTGQLRPEAAAVVPLLHAWAARPVANPDSAAALIFQQWYMELAAEVFAVRTGELYPRLLKRAYLLNHALDHLILHDADSPWWRGDRPAVLAAALNSAAAKLAADLGPNPDHWRLDSRLHVKLQHELGKAVPALAWLFDEPEQSWGGGTATVGRARYSYARPFAVNAAATVRAVAQMSPEVRMSAVIPGGQSGHPLSRHYADQYPGWLQGSLYPIAPTPEAVAGESVRLHPQR
tara:strand:+ start:159501 stop:161888 length:2388 start_codon:yes stop_codon:yes gene_type:complete